MNKKVKRTVRLNVTLRDTEQTATQIADAVRLALRTAGIKDFTVSPNLVVVETRYLFKGEDK